MIFFFDYNLFSADNDGFGVIFVVVVYSYCKNLTKYRDFFDLVSNYLREFIYYFTILLLSAC